MHYCGPMELLIGLTEEEERLARSYSASKGMSVDEAFKIALFERIEDEYDIAVAEAAYKRHLEGKRTFSHNEVLKTIGHKE